MSKNANKNRDARRRIEIAARASEKAKRMKQSDGTSTYAQKKANGGSDIWKPGTPAHRDYMSQPSSTSAPAPEYMRENNHGITRARIPGTGRTVRITMVSDKMVFV